MSDKSGDTLYWTDVYLKGQEEFLKRWSQFSAAAQPAAAAQAFTSPFGTPAGWPDWTQLFGTQQQYLNSTRALWETLAKAAAQPDPTQRVNEFTQGMQQLQAQFTSLWQSMLAPWSAAMAAAPGTAQASASSFNMAGMPGMPQSLDLPALGLTRERQEAMQKLQHLMGEYLSSRARCRSSGAKC